MVADEPDIDLAEAIAEIERRDRTERLRERVAKRRDELCDISYLMGAGRPRTF